MSQFVTTDTPLATYLITQGFEPQISIEKRKVSFVFSNSTDEFQNAVTKFNSGFALGNIPQYHDTYQRLIKMIRDMKKASK